MSEAIRTGIEEQGLTCEEKLESGQSCQVFLKMAEQTWIIDFDNTTTVGMLRTKLNELVSDELSDVSFFYVNGKAGGTLLKPGTATLLSLGVENTGGVPMTIQAQVANPGLKGGVMYGDENPLDIDFPVELWWTDSTTKAASLGTGTIYGKHVLTAAHNTVKKNFKEFTKIFSPRGTVHKIKDVHIINGFNDRGVGGYSSVGDVAVLTLQDDGYVPNTKIKFKGSMPLKDDEAYVAGYGMTQDMSFGPDRKMMIGKFKVFDNCHPRNVPGSQVLGCASSPDSPTKACPGDSGAPWFYKDPHEPNSYVIFGVHLGSDECRPGEYRTWGQADFTLLPRTVAFWKKWLPVS